jgi:ABC-type polysaccharide/polyol phosphate export permease
LLGAMPAPTIWIGATVMAVVGMTAALFMLGKLRHRVTYWL